MDVFKLGKLAYPTLDDNILKNIAVDVFIDGLRDPELQQNLRLLRPNTLGEPLVKALEYKSVKQSLSKSVRVREVNFQNNSRPDSDMQKTVTSLKDAVTKLKKIVDRKAAQTVRRPPRC